MKITDSLEKVYTAMGGSDPFKKDIAEGIDQISEVASGGGGGGGASVFLVTGTVEVVDDELVMTGADKTIAEIKSAYDDNEIVKMRIDLDGEVITLDLFGALDDSASFSTLPIVSGQSTSAYVAEGWSEGGSDEWTLSYEEMNAQATYHATISKSGNTYTLSRTADELMYAVERFKVVAPCSETTVQELMTLVYTKIDTDGYHFVFQRGTTFLEFTCNSSDDYPTATESV